MHIFGRQATYKMRDPRLALALSFCPGLGQHYAGHIYRGIVIYMGFILVSWLAAVAFMFMAHRASVFVLGVPVLAGAWIAWDAYRCAKNQPENYRLQWFNRLWIYAGVTVLLMLTVNPLMDYAVGKHIVRAFFMTGSGMAPTVLKHDILLVNKMLRPTHGSIVLVDFSDDGEQLTRLMDRQLLKRVIAKAGDSVAVRRGEVYLNGKKLAEPYRTNRHTDALDNSAWAAYAFGPEQVPEGHYYLLGDQRDRGIDSRQLGFIHQDRVAGEVTKVFWSWNLDDRQIKWSRTALSFSAPGGDG